VAERLHPNDITLELVETAALSAHAAGICAPGYYRQLTKTEWFNIVGVVVAFGGIAFVIGAVYKMRSGQLVP